ncbi:hypothetical protein [Paenibacillus sp. Leaf72]|uniref:hypothetical protein n=1 Tax=Paenibacillus sp. Leaf72 TaxID=1736234 RepID=UPI0006F3213E|nr:hypothetical protein [Paenibacillus sp. Leaf72]KQN96866.1 hypothetical protein ASF12_22620 [Paenibacillus sp. Leaf72]
MPIKTIKVNSAYSGETGKSQCELYLNFSESPIISVRSCPKNTAHEVYGEPFQLGGRVWYCADCGIEWRASLRTGYVKYYNLDEGGTATEFKIMKLALFNESRYLKKKTSLQPNFHLVSTEAPSAINGHPDRDAKLHDVEQMTFSYN